MLGVPSVIGAVRRRIVVLEDALHRRTPKTHKSQLAHFPRNIAATPARILPRRTHHELSGLWSGPGAPRSALGLAGPVAADDLQMPADQGGRFDDHEAVQQLSLLHPHAEEQHRQPLRPAEPRALP